MAKRERKLVAGNKKARHDYFIEEVYEVGIVLTAPRSNRSGRARSASRKAMPKSKRVRSSSTA